MKAELYFAVHLNYTRTEYSPLSELAVFHPDYSFETKKYRWIFRYADIEKVEAILNTIEIPDLREKKVIAEADVEPFKGKGEIKVIEQAEVYEVIEYRKQEDYSIKEEHHLIDKSLVDAIWNKVISKMPLYKKVKSSTVAENICRALKIDRFDRDKTHTFQFDKFFGSRHSYKTFLYYPLKILAFQGKIHHYKKGYVERRWD